MGCLFCKISKNEIPSDVVYEDETVKAFTDIHPKAPVHILIIPKEHVQSIAHLEAGNSEMIVHIIYAAKRIAAEKGLHGYRLEFNVGREAGQEIDHLHLHLLGGWSTNDVDNGSV